MSLNTARRLPECWGHRGASAAFPENTLASFEAAIRDGAEGIESDVHVSLDNVVVMFHDPVLSRTTNFKGAIREKPWHGPNGMHLARTIKTPQQAIPTFAETVALLMKPENKHVKFNVDCKVENDSERLFGLMHEVISAQPNWEIDLAPRILVGLWHPKFCAPARRLLPTIRLAHIGMSPRIAREFFWESCDTFSLNFPSLLTPAGERFRKECKAAGKTLMVWTVNRKDEMREAVRWEVDGILTDVTKDWLSLRSELEADYVKASTGSRLFLWMRLDYYSIIQFLRWASEHSYLEKAGGRFQKVITIEGIAPPVVPSISVLA